MSRQVPKSSYTALILQCLILTKYSTMAITNSKDNNQANLPLEFSARGIGRSLAQCFGSEEKLECLEMQFVNALDAAVEDNSTWQYSDFLAVEKKTSDSKATSYIRLFASSKERPQLERHSLSDTIGEKLLQLATSRSIRLTLPRISGVSDALDDLASSSAADEGTKRVFNGLVDDKIESISSGLKKPKKKKKVKTKKKKMKMKKKKKKQKNKIWYLNNKNPLKGRKKKDKDKNMAMMGGMAMLAMVAQLFLGKVILIAGAAFVMAKIALLISVLSSLKKGSSGSSGSTDHVIVTSGGGGGGHSHDSVSSGWHRSMPHAYDYSKIEVASEEHTVNELTPLTNDGLAPTSSNDQRWTPITGDGTHKPNYYNYDITENNAEEDNYKRKGQTAGFL